LSVLVVLLSVLPVGGCKKRPHARGLPAEMGLTGGRMLFEEEFSGKLDRWETTSKNWRVVDGRLYTGDRPNDNAGLWVTGVSLPVNARLEFEATSVQGNSPVFEGDVKCEFGGEKSEHLSGYIVIFGGWKNTLNTIAKQEEHSGRLGTDSTVKVEENKTYRFQIVRLGGEIKWFIDGKLLLRVQDDLPLGGGAFGFNNWNSRVYFDNFKIYAL
jgi:hypothetical protein